jgi:hypothetical protein
VRVLITNHALAQRAGTELYSRDLAGALRGRGHDVVLFTPVCGTFADAIRAEGIPVVDHLGADLAAPDVIHGQHHLPAMAALVRFPRTPAVFVCHGAVPWEEMPPAHPRIVRYVAVDDPCRERLDAAQLDRPIEVIPNFVDLARFRLRAGLPATPRRALVFSNSADPSWTDVVAAACQARAVALDIVGATSRRASERPEELLGDYDLVFAKARSALEAIASGCAVITCDRAGVGTMATADAWPELQRLNLGFRTLTRPHDAAVIGREIDRYDPQDARRLTDLVRRDAALDAVADRWVAIYGEIIAEHTEHPPSSAEEESALSRYLTWVGGSPPPGVRAQQELGRLGAQLACARQQLSAVHDTHTWRVRNALLSLPGVDSVYGLLRLGSGRFSQSLDRSRD